MKALRLLGEINVIFEVREIRNSNEDVLPPQPASVGGRLREFVEDWKGVKYLDQGVQTSV